MLEYFNITTCQDSKLNIEVRSKFKCVLDEKYGPSVDETIDIFPAKESDAPIVVFIHGGYWRSMTSKDFSLVARGLVLNGITVAIPNYSLCPKVSIPEITQQMRASLYWVYNNAHLFNGNRNQIFISGHSAGGQQVGMLSSTNWVNGYGLPKNLIKGGIPISGIFDLSPLYYSWLQPTLQLTHDVILKQSPLHQIPDYGFPLLVSVGDNESLEFKRQSKEYLSAWQEKGHKGSIYIQSGRNHFTTFRDLNDPNSQFCETVLKFMDQYVTVDFK